MYQILQKTVGLLKVEERAGLLLKNSNKQSVEIRPTESLCNLDPHRRGSIRGHVLPEILRNYNRRGSVKLRVQGPHLSGNKLSFYFYFTPSNIWQEFRDSGRQVFLQTLWGVGLWSTSLRHWHHLRPTWWSHFVHPYLADLEQPLPPMDLFPYL